MSIQSVGRRGRLLIAAASIALVLAVPATVSADTTQSPPTIFPAEGRGATIELSGGSVIGRLVANVRVSFTCDPFLVYDWETGTEVESTVGRLEFGAVTILQASGRTINYGEVSLFGGDVVCDGSAVNVREVGVVANVVPWKNGTAVAGARVYIVDEAFQASHYASTGALSIKLGR